MKPFVLLVDEDDDLMKLYRRAFRNSGFEIMQATGLNLLFEYLELVERLPDLIILDLMMPPGERYGLRESEKGLRTGELVYRDLRQLYPAVPIIFLTNIRELADLEDIAASDPNVFVTRKLEYTPFKLVDKALQILGREVAQF